MDMLTYALCKDNVIDLTQYQTTLGISINDVFLAVMQKSLESGGTAKKLVFETTDTSFRRAFNKESGVYIRCYSGVSDIVSPVTLTIYNGKLAQCNASYQLWASDVTLIDVVTTIVFDNDIENPSLYVLMSAKPSMATDMTL